MRRLRRWTAASWTVPAAGGATPGRRSGRGGVGAPTRAETAAAAVQRIADLAAAAEGEPRRAVPRLADIVLADQLAVVVDDVLRSGDPTATAALTAELAALRQTLLGR